MPASDTFASQRGKVEVARPLERHIFSDEEWTHQRVRLAKIAFAHQCLAVLALVDANDANVLLLRDDLTAIWTFHVSPRILALAAEQPAEDTTTTLAANPRLIAAQVDSRIQAGSHSPRLVVVRLAMKNHLAAGDAVLETVLRPVVGRTPAERALVFPEAAVIWKHPTGFHAHSTTLSLVEYLILIIHKSIDSVKCERSV